MREERLGEVFQGFEALAIEKEKSEKRMGLGREKERERIQQWQRTLGHSFATSVSLATLHASLILYHSLLSLVSPLTLMLMLS